MTARSPTIAETAARHATYRAALFPLALRHVQTGDYAHIKVIQRTPGQQHDLASKIAKIAAQDLVQWGRTLLFDMAEVAGVLPEFAGETIENRRVA